MRPISARTGPDAARPLRGGPVRAGEGGHVLERCAGRDPDRVDQGRHLRARRTGRRLRRDRRSPGYPGRLSPLASNASKRRKSPRVGSARVEPGAVREQRLEVEPVTGAALKSRMVSWPSPSAVKMN